MTNKRLLIFLVLSSKRIKARNALIKAFSHKFDDVVFVSDYDLENNVSPELFRSEFAKITSGFKKIYFISDEIMPLTNDFDELFAFMEKSPVGNLLWSAEDIYGYVAEKNTFAPPLFLCIDTASAEFELFGERLMRAKSTKEIASLLNDHIIVKSYFSEWAMKSNEGDRNTISFCFNAEEYLKKEFPFFPYGFFKLDRSDFIKYGTDHVPFKVFKRLTAAQCRLECLLEYFAEECDASRLKDLLQFNFIVGKSQNKARTFCEKYALFVHLYYECYFERYLEYLTDAANYCDVYVSVSSEEKKKLLLSMTEGTLNERLTIVLCKNRGRDVSALLIAFKPYIMKYEYFCFLHDKSSHECDAKTVGYAFSDCMWDNLLSIGTIPEIISFFDNNRYIGLLVPPTPYWGGYLKLKSDFWTVCYDKTLELSEKLGIAVKIDKEINPAALGTAFWCRTQALVKIFNYHWKYEDFDEEPLEADGTVSHAIERLFPYAALEQHFLTSWIVSEKFVPRILESHLLLTERYLRLIKQNQIIFDVEKPPKQIGGRGAICIFKKSAALLFKSLREFFYKRLHKKERNYKG